MFTLKLVLAGRRSKEVVLRKGCEIASTPILCLIKTLSRRAESLRKFFLAERNLFDFAFRKRGKREQCYFVNNDVIKKKETCDELICK